MNEGMVEGQSKQEERYSVNAKCERSPFQSKAICTQSHGFESRINLTFFSFFFLSFFNEYKQCI